MESKECKCTIAQIIGDGCAVCNPQMAIDILEEANTTLIEQNKKLRDVLDEARLQIEYMQNKFAKTGTGESVLATINRILNETE